MKRLGIFFFYDKNGIVDDYIYYLLDDICQNLDELCIVSNINLSQLNKDKLTNYTENIILRVNLGFNASAWREVMVTHYGFEKLSEFDEIVLFDNSFFGPIYPFKLMFDKMEKENIDFWGITEYDESFKSNKLCPYKKPPRYIETSFLVIRNSLIISNEFQEYWKNLPDYKSHDLLKFKHEVVFTKYFSDLGFLGKSFAPLSDEDLKQKTMDRLSFDMYEMIVNNKVPILKIKSFKIERETHLYYNLATDISNTINYIKENSNFDVSLIYKYLLRTMDPNEIVNTLNLVRIFPKNDILSSYSTNKKVLLIVHVYYEDLLEYDLKYLINVPNFIDILITTDSNTKKEFIEDNITKHLKNNVNVIEINSRGRDMASLLVASRKYVKGYDYFCFMHDKKPHANDFATWAETFRDVLWENNLASEKYINKIVQEFDENESLGLIVPPRIYHGEFFYGYVNNYWSKNYDIALELLDQMGIVTPISKDHPPLSLGNCFWARYDALEPIFNLYLDYTDFLQEPLPEDGTISHAIERIYPYVAASRGYFTEIVMTEEYAKSEILNHNYMLSKTLRSILKNYHGKNNIFASFNVFHKSLNKLFNKKIKKKK